MSINGSNLDKEFSLKMFLFSLSSKLHGTLTTTLVLKLLANKLEPWFFLWNQLAPWFFLWNLFLQSLRFISLNLPYDLTWNTVMSELVFLIAVWIFCISYRKEYVRFLIIQIVDRSLPPNFFIKISLYYNPHTLFYFKFCPINEIQCSLRVEL